MIGADFSGVNILMLVKFLCQELGRDVHSPGTSLGGGVETALALEPSLSHFCYSPQICPPPRSKEGRYHLFVERVWKPNCQK